MISADLISAVSLDITNVTTGITTHDIEIILMFITNVIAISLNAWCFWFMFTHN